MVNVIWKNRIYPFEYTDGRKPRLPRWQKKNKRYDLKKDTRDYFQEQLKNLSLNNENNFRFGIEITVFKGNDKQGGGDLDNYCKVILDGIKSTKKIWDDDNEVDDIILKRKYTTDKSHIELEVKSLQK